MPYWCSPTTHCRGDPRKITRELAASFAPIRMPDSKSLIFSTGFVRPHREFTTGERVRVGYIRCDRVGNLRRPFSGGRVRLAEHIRSWAPVLFGGLLLIDYLSGLLGDLSPWLEMISFFAFSTW